jgi:ubiquinone/menaquinone biosynthesis C-methylase UbiE
MDTNTYYRDHWVHIDEDRLERYEAMFGWHRAMAPLLDGADLTEGLRVLDFGCGPGGLSMEMARRVGATGHVAGLDLNHHMVARAQAHAADAGLNHQVSFAQHDGERLPFEDGSFDRAVSKSVLEYVPDPLATITQMRRVTRAGGKVHVIDSDWGMLVMEPLSPANTRVLFDAAKAAYRTPHIGRRLAGLFRQSGLEDINIRVLCSADSTGVRFSIARNMVSYAREMGTLDKQTLDGFEATLQRGLEAGDYLLVLPQFVVTGRVPVQ